jgi:hypothetical protein
MTRLVEIIICFTCGVVIFGVWVLMYQAATIVALLRQLGAK